MQKFLSDIPGSDAWLALTPLQKGWSRDQKFVVTTKEHTKMLLRISPAAERKQRKGLSGAQGDATSAHSDEPTA